MGPLDDVRVVEFCQIAAGPYCGMLLADLGADVIKVEHPETGDTMRNWPPFNKGFSENFTSLNRNKRSVALNLKSEAGLQAAKRLAHSADVVLENFRPGVLDRLGLGYEALSADKPALVYCSISAYGHSGPRAKEGAFDLTIQAMAGVMSVTGERDGPPVKCGVPLSDFSAGLYAAQGILAALIDVRRGRPGCHIDVPMLGATLGMAALQTSEYFGTGRDPERLGSAHPRNAPYQAFRARDGYFAMAAGNDRLWHLVCEIVEQPHWKEDARFSTTALRAANQEAMKELLEDRFADRDATEWLEAFRAAGVPCAPINGYSAVLADPHVDAMGMVEPIELPGGGQTQTVVSPLTFGGSRAGVRRRPPALGEHTVEVLSDLGLDGADVA